MATAVLSPCLNGKLLSITRREVEVRPKRRRVKNVTWQTEDKLCQVRTFSSDDAPSTSGFMLRAPISSSGHGKDFPPGFEGVTNKRLRFDAVSNKSMTVETPWHSPDKFVLDCAWLVVEGEESTEIVSQQHREIRVLEAVYPRSSSIPLSPAEPHENWKNIGDSLIPQIPSVPVEDEDDIFKEGSSLGFSIPAGEYVATHPNSYGRESEKNAAPHQQQDAKGVEEPSLCVTEEDTSQYGLVTASPINADQSIVGVAADASASLNPLKGSSLVDHELLFEILSNPALMKTLLSSGQNHSKSIEESLVKFSNIILAKGNRISNEEHVKGSSCLTACLQPNIQGVCNVDVSFRGEILQQGVETSDVHTQLAIGGVESQNSSCSIIHTQDQSHTRTASFGHSIGPQGPTNSQIFERSSKNFEMKAQAVAPSAPLTGQLNSFGGSALKHVADNKNPQAMQGRKDTTSELYGERLRMMCMGSQTELSARVNGLPEFCIQNHQRGDVAGTSFPEVARARPRKSCLYFNTPKGCRNGASCGFLHELRIEN